ncbi:kinase-like protein, partial [Gymnopus androsaceus JB14]
VVAGMTYLHSRDIVHADLKGANVLVDDNHNALVADFGLSQAIDGMRSRSGRSTRTDGARGTLRWMAPECLDGNPETIASDIYSLGLTIWEIFSDEVPFSNISDRILPRYVIDRKQRPVRPSRLSSEMQSSDAIWNLIQSCWAHEADSRPSTSALQRSLARYTSKLDSGKQGEFL